MSESLIASIQRKARKLAEDAADLATLILALDDFLEMDEGKTDDDGEGDEQ